MQVGQTSGHRLSDETELRPGQDVGFQVVTHRALRSQDGQLGYYNTAVWEY